MVIELFTDVYLYGTTRRIILCTTHTLCVTCGKEEECDNWCGICLTAISSDIIMHFMYFSSLDFKQIAWRIHRYTNTVIVWYLPYKFFLFPCWSLCSDKIQHLSPVCRDHHIVEVRLYVFVPRMFWGVGSPVSSGTTTISRRYLTDTPKITAWFNEWETGITTWTRGYCYS